MVLSEDRRKNECRVKCDECGAEYTSTPYSVLCNGILGHPDRCPKCVEKWIAAGRPK